jgi:hypothetical protein
MRVCARVSLLFSRVAKIIPNWFFCFFNHVIPPTPLLFYKLLQCQPG